MTPTQDQLVKHIQTAVAASPELQKQLAAVKSTDEAAALLTNAMGSPVTAADLNDISRTAAQDMTDDQLEAVAGGISTRDIFILLSVFSFGGACALASLLYATNTAAGGCKGIMSN